MKNDLTKYGFIKDENNRQFMGMFCNNKVFKEIYIDVYSSNPFDIPHPSLLLRHNEKKACVLNDNKNLIIKKNDKNSTYIINISSDDIKEVYFQDGIRFFDFVVNYQNIYYKITIFN